MAHRQPVHLPGEVSSSEFGPNKMKNDVSPPSLALEAAGDKSEPLVRELRSPPMGGDGAAMMVWVISLFRNSGRALSALTASSSRFHIGIALIVAAFRDHPRLIYRNTRSD
jgi:hypothetical protein